MRTAISRPKRRPEMSTDWVMSTSASHPGLTEAPAKIPRCVLGMRRAHEPSRNRMLGRDVGRAVRIRIGPGAARHPIDTRNEALAEHRAPPLAGLALTPVRIPVVVG